MGISIIVRILDTIIGRERADFAESQIRRESAAWVNQ
jgi:hypothetical protein